MNIFQILNLNIQRPPNITLHHDPVLNTIKKLENHPSILKIEKQIPSDVAFPLSYRKVTLNEVINYQSNDIPTKVIKEN